MDITRNLTQSEDFKFQAPSGEPLSYEGDVWRLNGKSYMGEFTGTSHSGLQTYEGSMWNGLLNGELKISFDGIMSTTKQVVEMHNGKIHGDYTRLEDGEVTFSANLRHNRLTVAEKGKNNTLTEIDNTMDKVFRYLNIPGVKNPFTTNFPYSAPDKEVASPEVNLKATPEEELGPDALENPAQTEQAEVVVKKQPKERDFPDEVLDKYSDEYIRGGTITITDEDGKQKLVKFNLDWNGYYHDVEFYPYDSLDIHVSQVELDEESISIGKEDVSLYDLYDALEERYGENIEIQTIQKKQLFDNKYQTPGSNTDIITGKKLSETQLTNNFYQGNDKYSQDNEYMALGMRKIAPRGWTLFDDVFDQGETTGQKTNKEKVEDAKANDTDGNTTHLGSYTIAEQRGRLETNVYLQETQDLSNTKAGDDIEDVRFLDQKGFEAMIRDESHLMVPHHLELLIELAIKDKLPKFMRQAIINVWPEVELAKDGKNQQEITFDHLQIPDHESDMFRGYISSSYKNESRLKEIKASNDASQKRYDEEKAKQTQEQFLLSDDGNTVSVVVLGEIKMVSSFNGAFDTFPNKKRTTMTASEFKEMHKCLPEPMSQSTKDMIEARRVGGGAEEIEMGAYQTIGEIMKNILNTASGAKLPEKKTTPKPPSPTKPQIG